MKLKSINLLIIINVLFYSCSGKIPEKKNKFTVDTTNNETTKKINETKEIKVVTKTNEKSENHIKIIEKFGEQWDFCTCVLANDSINSAFEKTISDAESNKLMKRWEHVELKCKEFLTSENKTPEQRIEHELKVKKCLKNGSK